jgi:hypothetical protein
MAPNISRAHEDGTEDVSQVVWLLVTPEAAPIDT